MFYVNFINLCAKNNVSPSDVAKSIGTSRAAISKWKNGGMPSDVTMAKLADYFNVSVDYLLGNETEKSPANAEDEELNEYLDQLKNNPGMRVLFSKTKNATKEDLEKVIKMLDIMKGDI